MPFRKWTRAQKAEAIALADVVGVDEAARQLGMGARAIHEWRKAAGKRPEIDVPATTWRTLHELALAKVSAALTSGRVSPTQAATIAAIAARNAEKPEPPPDKSDGDSEIRAAIDELEAFIRTEIDPEGRHSIGGWWMAVIRAADENRRYLEVEPNSDDLADDELDEAVAAAERARDAEEPFDYVAFLRGVGDLDEWFAAYRQREAERQATVARDNERVKRGWEMNLTVMLEVGRQEYRSPGDKRRALLAAADELVAGQNEEVRALLAEAEAFLAENAA